MFFGGPLRNRHQREPAIHAMGISVGEWVHRPMPWARGAGIGLPEEAPWRCREKTLTLER